MAKTQAALAAQAIRSELKKNYPKLKFTCRSEVYSGGNSIRVAYKDQSIETHEAIKSLLAKYEYGHFNGMDDIYEITNSRDDIPQTKYLFIDNEMSEEKRAELYALLRQNRAGGQDLPEKYEDAININFQGEWVSTWIWRAFNGTVKI